MTVTATQKDISRTLVSAALQHELEQFLYEEADLLDAWKLEEWLGLMADDLQYWAPTRQNRLYREQAKEIVGPAGAAYFDEDLEFLTQRVQRLRTGLAWAEDPLSRVRHLICNVRVQIGDQLDEYKVESSFYVFRTHYEREMDCFVGKRHDVIRRANTPAGWAIAKRTIVIDMATLLAKNISIFF
jgi:3-phenylpropionate/cinnamic acid dioxygenase small subunit